MRGRGTCKAEGGIVAGGVHGRGHVCQGHVYGRGMCVAGRGCTWQEACMTEGAFMAGGVLGRGGCVAEGSMTTAADCMHTTGMHSCFIYVIMASLFGAFCCLLPSHAGSASRIPHRRGRQPSRGTPTYDSTKFSKKLHEIKNILGHGGHMPGAPPRSATAVRKSSTKSPW